MTSGDLVIGGSGDRKATTESHYGDTEARRNRVQNAWYVVCAVVSEIFDESAYQRFLKRTRSSRSKASYRDFMRERESAIAQKPRCC